MTKDEFHKLSVTEQNTFILSGESFVTGNNESCGELEVGVNGQTDESLCILTNDDSNDSNVSAVTSSHQSVPSFNNTINSLEEFGFDFKNPVELLYFLDDDIASGQTVLHKWQIQFMIDFANDSHTKDKPFKAEVRACNGSGKDKYIVAVCAVWLCSKYIYARSIVTNGSGQQLDNQTEVYINHLCERFNAKVGSVVWKINYRYYECLVTHSPITLFATDESNKAEGYHPLKNGGKMAIFASEAKAIPDEIFTALNRCTGFTHRIDVSTPGLPLGTFYDRCSTAIKRKNIIDIKSVDQESIEYHITAFDCSHITKSEIETMKREMPGGETGTAYRSAVLSEFGSGEEMVVIPYTYIWKSYTDTEQSPAPKYMSELRNKAGLDLSDGGDETVLIIRNGNRHLATIPFKFDNTEDTITFLDERFKEYNLRFDDAYIFADCGGIGKPILNRLVRMGWRNIRFIDNRNTASLPKTYLNRGTELYFHFRQLLERHELILLHDKKLMTQLSTRKYKMDNNNRHRLISKPECRSKGIPSPDRADALVLAFWDYKSTFIERSIDNLTEDTLPFKQPLKDKPVSALSIKSWANDKYDSGPASVIKDRQKNFTLLQRELDKYKQKINI